MHPNLKMKYDFMNDVIAGDSIDLIKHISNESIHAIISDIPYGIGMDEWDVLHENKNSAYLGTSPAQEKAGAIFKKRGKPINGWSESDKKIPLEYQNWCSNWVNDWYRVLKPGASVFIFAGRRFSHRCVCAMEDAGFNLKDTLAWLRSRAPHRAQRLSIVYEKRNDVQSSNRWSGWRIGNLRPTFEPVLWFVKPYKTGTTIADNVLKHHVGGYNEQAFLRYMPQADNIITGDFTKNESGLHPTQKPINLMATLIDTVTIEGQTILDPFCGSGSTLIAAKQLKRNFIGFEMSPEYVQIAKDRLINEDLLF